MKQMLVIYDILNHDGLNCGLSGLGDMCWRTDKIFLQPANMSSLGDKWTGFFMYFLCPYRKMLGYQLKIDCTLLCPHTYQPTINNYLIISCQHYRIFPSTLWCYRQHSCFAFWGPQDQFLADTVW